MPSNRCSDGRLARIADDWPAFVLMTPDDLESLEETLDIMRDDELVESLRRSLQEAAEGKLLPLPDGF